MNIVFLHPDLGIGGAERLVVDAALALKAKGHHVQFFTCHHDCSHCFQETKDGTIDVTVVGNWIPRSLFGRFHALCAYLQMLYAAFYLTFLCSVQPELVFCDQVSVCVPVLKLKTKVIFYCHFPDQLLTSRTNWLKWIYRLPLDWFEEYTTGIADIVLVNSEFTASVFFKTFRSLKRLKLEVLYPVVNLVAYKGFDPSTPEAEERINFLSVNRYERKKNINLAIEALRELKSILPAEKGSKIHLIIAGGYDDRLAENREYFVELVDSARLCGLLDQITFLKSPNDKEKRSLFHTCTAVLYTPQNEHFGIVPLEAMFFSRPVIACNSGGPLETIKSGETGYLCEPTPAAFAKSMKLFICEEGLSQKLGHAGAKHVRNNFSLQAFGEKLDTIVNSLF